MRHKELHDKTRILEVFSTTMTFVKRHPYIIAFIAAIVLSIVAWCLVPKEYAARTKLCDEYKEMDLAIGLDKWSAKIREMSGSENSGVNDIEVYCMALKTDDFARKLSKKSIDGKGITYGQYIAVSDTIDEIKTHIEYNISIKQQSIKIQFTDKNPLIAARMLQYTVDLLQDFVTKSRRATSEALLANADRNCQSANANYRKTQKAYAAYMDSHVDDLTTAGQQQGEALKNEVDNAYAAYQKATEQYTRQKALTERAYVSFAVVQAIEVPQESNNHFIGYFIAFTTVALYSVKAFFLGRKYLAEKRAFDFGDIFSPWTLTLLIWGSLGVVICFSGDVIDPVPDVFYQNIAIWICIFVATSFLVYNLLPATRCGSRSKSTGLEINQVLFNAFFFLALVMTPMYLYQIYKIISMFDAKDLMSNMRELAVHGDGYGFLNYAMVINQSLLLVALWCYPRIPTWKMVCTILCCIAFAVANMEKITFFLVFIVVIYVLFERKVIKIRTIAIFGVILVFAFYLFNLSRTADDNDYKDNTTILDFMGMYLMSPPVAFGHLHHTISAQFCQETLWTIYAYTARFFSGETIQHDAFGDFVFVPMATNVYTIMKPFYQDLGSSGVAFFAFLYGLGSGIVYRKAKNGQAFSVCLYTYMVFVLTLQFFDELVFASIPQFVQRMFLLFIMCQTEIKVTFKKLRTSHSEDF